MIDQIDQLSDRSISRLLCSSVLFDSMFHVFLRSYSFVLFFDLLLLSLVCRSCCSFCACLCLLLSFVFPLFCSSLSSFSLCSSVCIHSLVPFFLSRHYSQHDRFQFVFICIHYISFCFPSSCICFLFFLSGPDT